MSLKTHGSYLKAFLADPSAWSDYGGYEAVLVSINQQPPTLKWHVDDIADHDAVEILSGYRLDGAGRRLGCFVANISAWLMDHQGAHVRVELPAAACPQLNAWAHRVGARCSVPAPVCEPA